MYMGLAKNLLNICMRNLLGKSKADVIIHNFPLLVKKLMNRTHKNWQ